MNPTHKHSFLHKKFNLAALDEMYIRERLQLIHAEGEQQLSEQTACVIFVNEKKAKAAFQCCICLEDIDLLSLCSKDQFCLLKVPPCSSQQHSKEIALLNRHMGRGTIALYITHCGHAFHKKCLETWAQENPICPICKCEIEGF